MIGDKIKYFRMSKRYSQEQLARKLHVTQGAVSQWEKGRTAPDTMTLLNLAKLFDVSLDVLTDDSPVRELDSIAIKKSDVPIIGEIACGVPIVLHRNRHVTG